MSISTLDGVQFCTTLAHEASEQTRYSAEPPLTETLTEQEGSVPVIRITFEVVTELKVSPFWSLKSNALGVPSQAGLATKHCQLVPLQAWMQALPEW
jgi:hypothetical protein